MSVGLANLAASAVQLVVSLSDDALHGTDSLVIVFKVSAKDAAPLMKTVDIFVDVVGDVSETRKLAIVGMVDFFLIVAKMLEVLDILAEA